MSAKAIIPTIDLHTPVDYNPLVGDSLVDVKGRRFIVISQDQIITMGNCFLFHPPILSKSWFDKYTQTHLVVLWGSYLPPSTSRGHTIDYKLP